MIEKDWLCDFLYFLSCQTVMTHKLFRFAQDGEYENESTIIFHASKVLISQE